jgi:hypothetical protein
MARSTLSGFARWVHCVLQGSLRRSKLLANAAGRSVCGAIPLADKPPHGRAAGGTREGRISMYALILAISLTFTLAVGIAAVLTVQHESGVACFSPSC